MNQYKPAIRIVAAFFAVLFVGCDSKQPLKIQGEEEATLSCIRNGSWKPLQANQSGAFPPTLALIVLKNETGSPILYDFLPWWGDMDNYAITPTAGVLTTTDPCYIPDGKTAGIRINHSIFFRDGALLVFWTQSADQGEASNPHTFFDSPKIRRIQASEMGSENLTVTLGKNGDIIIQPNK